MRIGPTAAGLVLIVGAVSGCQTDSKSTAFINCQDAVRAYFRNPVDSHIKLSEATFDKRSDGGWDISGPASANNDFGTPKLLYYTCSTDKDGNVTDANVTPG